MKRILSSALVFLMLFGVAVVVEATNKDNRVYSETISAKAGETVEIPIKIENNTGIMGFAIDVSYDSDTLTPVSVKSSELLIGMLNDSIETSDSDSFTVLYTGSESFSFNGTLFTLTFNANEKASGNVKIGLAYTQENTFDGNFNDVVLNCETVSVIFDNGSSDPTDPSDPDDPTDPVEEDLKLSVKIKNWATGLSSPWNTIMSIIVAPVVFVLQIFGR